MEDDENSPHPVPLTHLLRQMRGGSPEAVSRFIDLYSAYLRQRIDQRLSQTTKRRLDSSDVISELYLRLNRCVENRHLRAANERQFWKLVWRLVDFAVIDRIKLHERLGVAGDETCPAVQHLLARFRVAEQCEAGTESELDQFLRIIVDETDRQILILRAHECPHEEIAMRVGLSSAAVRQRWINIRSLVQAHTRDRGDRPGTPRAE